jgi:hypothetical protein
MIARRMNRRPMMTRMVRQGDILLELVTADQPADAALMRQTIKPDADGAVVLARGEATGHRHAIWAAGTTMFRDDALAGDMADPSLYVGHLVINAEHVDLVHEEHDAIPLVRGVWRVRRQREFNADQARLVAD